MIKKSRRIRISNTDAYLLITIQKRSEACNFFLSLIVQVEVENVIDVGSGLGHLSRYLCYAHNIQVPFQLSSLDLMIRNIGAVYRYFFKLFSVFRISLILFY